ncbi:hypothetical protein EV424DRAFT_1353990 [Suillus variegatus]|nr:hypothetical protein EV424DRAFT_1353990 [Suillus variegatus]
MSSTNNITTANKAFSDAANRIDHLLGQASQLDAVDLRHLTIAMEMGKILTQVMMSHSGSVTVLSPLLLSAAAELQHHMNTSRTGISGAARHLCRPARALLSLQGALQWRSPKNVGEAPSVGNGQKSKVVVSSDNELDEETLATPAVSTTTKVRRRYVEIDDEEDMEEEANEEDTMEPPRKSTATVVALPIPSSPNLMEDEFANPSVEVWAPRCRQCVARDLICRQAYHKDYGGKLRVCAQDEAKVHNSAASLLSILVSPVADPPVHAPAISEVEEEQPPMAQSQIWAEPALASPSNEELQDLQDEVAGLRATIEALRQQVITVTGNFRRDLQHKKNVPSCWQMSLKVFTTLVVSVTTQPPAETLSTNAHPGVQSPSVATTQPPLPRRFSEH